MDLSRPEKNAIWLLLMAAMLHCGSSKITDWMKCNEYLPGCNCKTIDGRKQTECVNVDFSSISSISNEIQVLRFDNNNVRLLEGNAFRNAGLENLQKIIMPNCSIMDVNKRAFAGLSLVLTIDLSNNAITQLDPLTFHGTERLRVVNLNNNLIRRLEDHLFWNLSFLQKVELNDNRIEYISNRAFSDLRVLSDVSLKNNQLTTVPATIFNHLDKLTSLELQNNPWRCDCNLREFFEYTRRISISQPTYCTEPEYMCNRSWATLQPEEFICPPDMVGSDTEVSIDELTLRCKVVGGSKLQTDWMFTQRLNKRPLIDDHKYTMHEGGDNPFWSNLTISKLSHQDEGTYTCVTRSATGRLVEKKVHVTFSTRSEQFVVPRINNARNV